MMARALSFLACLLILAPAGARADEARTARDFAALRGNPVAQMIFLRAMPKGGDLHNHLAGAVYAESMIGWAARDGICVAPAVLKLSLPPCNAAAGDPPLSEAIDKGALHHDLVDALSMRDFQPSAGRSGHDQFFATFAGFPPLGPGRDADEIAEVADRAGAEHVAYLELMWSPGMDEARALVAEGDTAADLDALSKRLAPGVSAIAGRVGAYAAATDARVRDILKCGTTAARPGCGVTIRYLAQVIRTTSPARVFAQEQLGYALVESGTPFVGVNLVAPEDDPITLRDYHAQMLGLAWLSAHHPAVPLSLHAGELTLGLVPPEDLRFHIREAVRIAGARRIGHGVDVAFEDDAPGLLRDMAARKVMVEINLTSNDLILGVSGADHPFQTYRDAGVPVALSTDDEGVSRIDLTHEFARAVRTYGLGYLDLKTLARNSLEYGFLAGQSLWTRTAPFEAASVCAGTLGGPHPPPACQALLDRSEKAALQWRLEGDFGRFEALH